MKKGALILMGFIFILGHGRGQQSLHDLRQKGRLTLVYRIPADSAEKYLASGMKAVDHFLNQPAYTIFNSDSVQYDKLPRGNYLLLSVVGDKLLADYYCRVSNRVYAINNQHRVQLNIIDEQDRIVTNALVWVNRISAKYHPTSNTYSIVQKKPEDAIIKVVWNGDTSFFQLSGMDNVYESAFTQKWRRFKGTRAGRVVAWLPNRVRIMIRNSPRYWFRKKYSSKQRANGKGYVIFSKPKYKLADTVKFKAYILDKKGRRYKKDIKVNLNYAYAGKTTMKTLAILKPTDPAAYIYEFAVADTLPLDSWVNLFFETTNGQRLLNASFYLEDYLLDEVATYHIRSERELYYKSDSIAFTATANDANGLPLMDGQVKLLLLNSEVQKFYGERVFVPDTLWQQEKQLLIEGETKFTIPTTDFPLADLRLKALAIFRNSNNEIQEKQVSIRFNAAESNLIAGENDGYVSVIYYEKGKQVTKHGWMNDGINEKPVQVQFPYSAKIDPYSDKYIFFIQDDKGKKILTASLEPASDYQVSFNRLQKKDTVGFNLYNPKKVPVYYTIFNGNRVIDMGRDSSEIITWKGKIPVGRTFTLKWQYYWAGKERSSNEALGLLSKLVSTEIKGATTVYPGQTDTITVNAKDYMGRPATNVNLTAVSYNAQFGSEIKVPEPPYLEKFRGKLTVKNDGYEAEKASYYRHFVLGEHQAWRTKFDLDTIPFYQFLFPGKNYHMVRTRINEAVPQVSVHVVKKGVLQEIYLLYINRQPVYYNDATDQPAYAYEVYPGYAQIGIRLRDRYIEIDSVYMQPFYKHDISFDLDSLPEKAIVRKENTEWSWQEKALLQDRMLMIENNHRNNYGYVWQGDKVIYLNGSKQHLVGPFKPSDFIQFFKPGDFDFMFQFEPGYRYRVSPGVVRLEREYLFPYRKKQVYKLPYHTAKWKLGDTLSSPPRINYAVKSTPYLEFYGNNYYYNSTGYSKIIIDPVKDTIIAFTILHSGDTSGGYRVLGGGVSQINQVAPGKYTLLLVTSNFNVIEATQIEISTVGTYCIRFTNPVYRSSNTFIDLLQHNQKARKAADTRISMESRGWFFLRDSMTYYTESAPVFGGGGRKITGRVYDAKGGSPVPHASIIIKGTRIATTTDAMGQFVIHHVPDGAVLIVASVGYETYEVRVTESNSLGVALNTSNASLSEVVVVGYATTRRSMMLSPSLSVRSEDITGALQGRVPGIMLRSGVSDSAIIRIRGNSTYDPYHMDLAMPLFIINGVPMDELPANLDTAGLSINILKGSTAVQLYGSRAINGVIIINTSDFNPKSLREQFRDYAFWQPNLVTNRDGEVKFAVTYPDNITSWQTYVVGMDKKKRITKSGFVTKAFKPLLAQLATPQFLVEGDSATLIGKGVNYTTSPVSIRSDFRINGISVRQEQKEIAANNSLIDELKIKAETPDTITLQYSIDANAGFGDGEKKTIPVFRKGTEEAIGKFWTFTADTTVTFTPDNNAGSIHLYAQNNTLDVLLDEIEHLKKYPFYCMEQTASKVKGLIAEKIIRQALNQTFTGEKELQKLLDKLKKEQLYDGGWGWWQGGDFNLSVTNYIIQALLPLRSDPSIESSIRNGLLNLQNRLSNLKRNELLSVIYTLSEAGHGMEYKQYLDKIPFDSLSLHQQWQVVKIRQTQKLGHEKELKLLMDKKIETMLGGVHWGADSYYWDNNRMSTTALAFKVLEKEAGSKDMLNSIIQFFLGQRTGGRWRNTVESAVTLETILPTILEDRKDFNTTAKLTINGTSTDRFPYEQRISEDPAPLMITKSGGGIMYVTAWQQIFNKSPMPVTDKFLIHTSFEKNGRIKADLKAGERVTMKVTIEVVKDAEYVQVEIPIPAGCSYAEKKQEHWGSHKEFFKNKVVMFIEKMNTGKYVYEIELEPRYTGNYHLNPAKAELMYFPVFYGRNEMKRLEIKK